MKHAGKLLTVTVAISICLPSTMLSQGPIIAIAPGAQKAESDSAALNPTPAGVGQTAKQQVAEKYGKLPLIFEANHGQNDSSVKFVSRGPGYNLYLKPTEAVLTLRTPKAKAKLNKNQKAEPGPIGAIEFRGRLDREAAPDETATVRMKLVGGSAKAEVLGIEQQSAKVNYFIGNDPQKWQTEVSTYGRVQYKDVYPGVDLVYYGKQRQLEYDFVVKPGADPNQIRLRFDGAKKIRIDESGELVLTTRGGDIRQHKPVVYQEVTGHRKEIMGSYPNIFDLDGRVGIDILRRRDCLPA